MIIYIRYDIKKALSFIQKNTRSKTETTMEKIGLIEAIDQQSEYKKMLPKDRVQLRKKRLYELVTYAAANSPLYKDIYEDLPTNFTIQNLPTVTKDVLIARFDDWSTDRSVDKGGIQAYLDELGKAYESCDKKGMERKYLDKYHVVSSSGTDSEPLINLYDDNCCRIMSVNHLYRAFSRREHLWGFLTHGRRLASIYSTSGSYFFNVFAHFRRRYLPFNKKRSIILQSQSATSRLVETLNNFKPSVISGFPSVLTRMADERAAGRLKVDPVCIIAEGEVLEDDVRKKIADAFHCDVTSSYSTAETGVIAYECREHHLHINDDWLILEPVDVNGRPVHAGIESDKVLITNLLSYPQPIIRYELGDKVILHEEGCLCGNPSPWIEMAGRSLDQIRFVEGMKEVVVPVADFEAVLRDEPSIKRYQIIVYAGNRIALRLSGARGTDKTMAFFKAEKLLRAYMKSIGIMSPMITLDKEDPGPDPKSGKYKRIIIE